jgi:hypothetical protein
MVGGSQAEPPYQHDEAAAQAQSLGKRDLWVITIAMIAVAKRMTSGIRATGIRTSIYRAAIDHNDNRPMASHIKLSAIVSIKRTQTGRVLGPEELCYPRNHLSSLSTREKG